jgi:hypothetical protein
MKEIRQPTMKSFLLVCCAIVSFSSSALAFIPPASRLAVGGVRKHVIPTPETITTSSLVELHLMNNDDDNVNVNLIPDVDAFTLTAVGFGLIAFNFFVLANVS